MISYPTLILILAIMLMVASVISMIIALYIGTSPSDVSLPYIRLPKVKRFFIMSIVFFAIGGFASLISGNKLTDAAYSRYVRETAPDSGYSVYYNGQSVSGSALSIDKTDFHDFDIKYDEKNKIIRIMQKR